MNNPHANVAPPEWLSPFERLIANAACELGKRRVRITPEALAEVVGLPVYIISAMHWKVKSLEDAK